MLPKMLEHDRRQAGWSVGQAALRLSVSPREYRELEAGARSPSFETWAWIHDHPAGVFCSLPFRAMGSSGG